ncbi:MAG: homoserine dehydrogenase [Akkermansia sp.]
MERPIQIGLAGLGTVGTGVYETLNRNHDILEARAKIPFLIKKVAVHDLNKPREIAIPPEQLTNRWQDLVEDPEIDIIIELIGGTTAAYELITASLKAGKPVVTGNKALLAERGSDLFMLSDHMGTPLYFEASAGGGIPIIESLRNSLICNHINSVVGIINGTSNYILSAMEEFGASYSEALQKAIDQGFAEADPTLDVNGWDAAHKALILAMLSYGVMISPDKIFVSGIENISACDFGFAKKLGYTIKLLVVIRFHRENNALELRVQPCFVPLWHILSSVHGVFNAIAVTGDIVGETLFYGRGAGKNPTSSAVISDVITAMRESRHPQYHTGFNPYATSCLIMNIDDTVTPYYVRFCVEDRPGVIAEMAGILARHGIGISATSSSYHGANDEGSVCNDLVFVLHACPWGQLQNALEGISRIPHVHQNPSVLRIEHLTSES